MWEKIKGKDTYRLFRVKRGEGVEKGDKHTEQESAKKAPHDALNVTAPATAVSAFYLCVEGLLPTCSPCL